jgi:hydroxyacylglutathione hydrolase
MEIKQFFDDNLAHASYAVYSEGEIAIVDPARNPKQYLDFAKEKNGKITAIFETHPHADFVSSHLELHKKTGADIYVGKLVGVEYPHKGVDEGDEIKIGDIKIEVVNTPGHSPDSITLLIKDENGQDYAIASGDTLFVGDVGRPDLRESAGNINQKREELAGEMFETVQNKLKKLSDNVLVYPAHGAGSLCGKATSDARFSTIGAEKKDNYAFQINDKNKFIDALLEDQPFIPSYFGYDVELNRKGAPDFEESIKAVPRLSNDAKLKKDCLVIDTRRKDIFKKGHLEGAINIEQSKRFETWLGTIVKPEEKFYLICEGENDFEKMIERAAKIGYEVNIAGVLTNPSSGLVKSKEFDLEDFKKHPEKYNIVDVRNQSETKHGLIFDNAKPIPLPELRKRLNEIPKDKPVVFHCAGGGRGATAMSIAEAELDEDVYDLGAAIKDYSGK